MYDASHYRMVPLSVEAQSYYLSSQYQVTAPANGTDVYGVDSSGSLYLFNQATGNFHKATLSGGSYSVAFQFQCCSGQGVWATALAESNGDIYYTTGANPNSVATFRTRGNFGAPSNFYVGAVSPDDTVVFGSVGSTLWAIQGGQSTSLGQVPSGARFSAAGPGNVLYLVSAGIGTSSLIVDAPSGSGYTQSSYTINGTIDSNGEAVDSQGNLFFIQGNDLVIMMPSNNTYQQKIVGTLPSNLSGRPVYLGVDGSDNLYVSVSGSSALIDVYVFSLVPATPAANSRLVSEGGIFFYNGAGHACQYSYDAAIMVGWNTSSLNIPYYPSLPALGIVNDGVCGGWSTIHTGNFLTADGTVYFANGTGHACSYENVPSGIDFSQIAMYPTFPNDLAQYDGVCAGWQGPNQYPTTNPPAANSNFVTSGGIFFSNGQGHACQITYDGAILRGWNLGKLGLPYFPSLAQAGLSNDGVCGGTIPTGPLFAIANGTLYFSNGVGHSCRVSITTNTVVLAMYPFFPSDLIQNDGPCGN